MECTTRERSVLPRLLSKEDPEFSSIDPKHIRFVVVNVHDVGYQVFGKGRSACHGDPLSVINSLENVCSKMLCIFCFVVAADFVLRVMSHRGATADTSGVMFSDFRCFSVVLVCGHG